MKKENKKWWLIGGSAVILLLTWIFMPTDKGLWPFVTGPATTPDLVQVGPNLYGLRAKAKGEAVNEATTSQLPVTVVQAPAPTEGTISNFPPGQWVLVAQSFDPTKRIDITAVETDGQLVVYKARLDRSSKRVTPLYASDDPAYRQGHIEVVNGFNTIEIMVEPGQSYSFFNVHWAISPRTP